ncbi:ribose/xylose/arabinose/galactoside ABC-type transport system permease subunit [Rhizobium sp. BK176]|nr:ribose/xylose/arabinose/galactoside ABC-type transport system permease subunit [Rhizobium sp. BK399]MCS4096741.1 ribose/xylose/arabinose/galactoside ABC-type transport system permease subunit [Rhizobium sp. BK176]
MVVALCVGGNAEAARLVGVRVRLLRFSAVGLTGLGGGNRRSDDASRVASANPTQGSGLMLSAIAAVFLGMTMSEEGEPASWRRCREFHSRRLDNGLTQMSVDSYVREILVGSTIILAVASSSLSKLSQKEWPLPIRTVLNSIRRRGS